ncbi:MAG: protein kinase, partial [Deltaproteobacteria bacterium]|nr:protein kinase [Deltaproteobacteria bacterium]
MNCPVCAAELEIDATFCGACGFRMRARRGSLVGVTIDGRYHVEARIAAGGFGAIYRAHDEHDDRVVALKVLHGDLASDAGLAARFRREGTTLSSLRSPHTVSTYAVGEADDGTLYIAMELLRGESLHDRFRAYGSLPWRSVLGILRGVCASLAEAHALGIVHRDLKPANIHLEPDPTPDHVKVIDFGIAKLMSGSISDDGSDLTRVGTAVGTLDYMSPEQLVGTPADGRSDIFTLGIVAYEMIVGQRPFADATGPTSLMTALFTRVPMPPSAVADVPAELDALVLRCLEREVGHRFASVEELDAAIADLLARHPEPPRATLLQSLADAVGASPFLGEENTVRDRPILLSDQRLLSDLADQDFALASTSPSAPQMPGPADEATVVEAFDFHPPADPPVEDEPAPAPRRTPVGHARQRERAIRA